MTTPDIPAGLAPAEPTDAELKGKPIGEILVRLGRITREQLDEALKLSKDWGTSVGKVLLSQG